MGPVPELQAYPRVIFSILRIYCLLIWQPVAKSLRKSHHKSSQGNCCKNSLPVGMETRAFITEHQQNQGAILKFNLGTNEPIEPTYRACVTMTAR